MKIGAKQIGIGLLVVGCIGLAVHLYNKDKNKAGKAADAATTPAVEGKQDDEILSPPSSGAEAIDENEDDILNLNPLVTPVDSAGVVPPVVLNSLFVAN